MLYQRGLLDLETSLGDLLPGFVVGRAPGGRAREVTLRHLLAHNSGLAGLCRVFSQRHHRPSSSFAPAWNCLLKPSPAPRRVFRSRLYSARQSPGSLHTRAPRNLGPSRGLPAARHDRHRFCPPQQTRALIPPTEEDTTFRHRRIQGEVQDENAWVLKGAAGHAGLFSNVPDLLRFAAEILDAGDKGVEHKAAPVRRRDPRALCPAARPRRQFAGAWLGYALGEFLVRPAFLAAFDRAPWLQRLFALDRPGRRYCRRAAHQPHLARPEEPADSPGQARFSRCRSRGALVFLKFFTGSWRPFRPLRILSELTDFQIQSIDWGHTRC